jgi:hypothetical protein
VAYVASGTGQQSLRLRQVATGKDLEIVPPTTVDYYGLTFSHDGNFIYYVSQEMNRVGLLFRVPALGGAPARLIEDVDSPVTLSPDDRRLAFIASARRAPIVVATADATGERRLAVSSNLPVPDRTQPGSVGSSRLVPRWPVDRLPGRRRHDERITTIRALIPPAGVAPADDGTLADVGRMEWLADGAVCDHGRRGSRRTAADLVREVSAARHAG